MYSRETLVAALFIAISKQEASERLMGYTRDSAMLAVFRQMLKDLEEGRQLELRD